MAAEDGTIWVDIGDRRIHVNVRWGYVVSEKDPFTGALKELEEFERHIWAWQIVCCAPEAIASKVLAALPDLFSAIFRRQSSDWFKRYGPRVRSEK